MHGRPRHADTALSSIHRQGGGETGIPRGDTQHAKAAHEARSRGNKKTMADKADRRASIPNRRAGTGPGIARSLVPDRAPPRVARDGIPRVFFAFPRRRARTR